MQHRRLWNVLGLTVMLAVGSSFILTSEARGEAASSLSKGKNVVVIMDKSATTKDELDKYKKGAHKVIDSEMRTVPGRDKLAVVSFDATPKADYPLGTPNEGAKRRVGAIKTGRGKNIDDGIWKGFKELLKEKEPKGGHFLIQSDWFLREKKETQWQELLSYADSMGWVPQGISLRSRRSQYIARRFEKSGGSLYLHTTPDEIITNTDMLLTEMESNALLGKKELFAVSPKSYTQEVQVDSSIKELTFILKSAERAADLTITKPDGSLIKTSDTNVTIVTTRNNRLIRVNNPPPGTWKVKIDYEGMQRLKVLGKSDISLELLTHLKAHPQKAKLIKAQLIADNQTLAKSRVFVELYRKAAPIPTERIELFDDGSHQDDLAGDGIYANTFKAPKGSYPIIVRAMGKNRQDESYVRELPRMLVARDLSPLILEKSPVGKIRIATPTISAQLIDDGKLDSLTAEVWLDGKMISPTVTSDITGELINSARVSIAPPTLVEGEHWVNMVVRDKGREMARTAWNFSVDLPYSTSVIISEVSPSGKWAELYCINGPIDISGYLLTDLDGKDKPLAKSRVTLQTGQYALVHWTKGVDETDATGDLNGNGVIDLYLEKDTPPSPNLDQLVLMSGEAIIDALVWEKEEAKLSERTRGYEKEDLSSLAKEGEWGKEASLKLGYPTQSLGRRTVTSDTNKMDEWAIQPIPTPGRENRIVELAAKGSIIINEVHPILTRGDWAELYCINGPVNLAGLVLTDLKGVLQPLVTSPTTLRSGGYALVHWGEGGIDETDRVGDINKNEIKDIYIESTRGLSSTDSQLVLLAGKEILDAVIWTDGDGKMVKPALRQVMKVVNAGAWQGSFSLTDQSGAAKLGTPAQSIGRIPNAKDTNTKNDWRILIKPSPAKENKEVILPKAGSIIITEVSLTEFYQADWAEIYCISGPVNISNLVLTDLDGLDSLLADSPVTLKTGEYAVIHWDEGVDETDKVGDLNKNGYRDLYIPDQQPAATDDQLAIMRGNEIVDAVVWSNYDGKMSKGEAEDGNKLVGLGQWRGRFREGSQSDAVRMGEKGISIGRKEGYPNTNSKGDWIVYSRPTIGKKNR